MKTRTLLLLAVVCGLAILVAGGIKILDIANQDPVDPLELGASAHVGDVDVTVTRYDETPQSATVLVRIGGVEDDDGADAFRLVLPGVVLEPTGQGVDDCGPLTVEVRECTLTFALDDPAGGDRILRFERGDTVARWALSADPA